MSREPETFSDKELDALLAEASQPRVPLGARERLLAKLGPTENQPADTGSVIAFPSSTPRNSRMAWLAGLPLAASLALGIYLGAAGAGASILPTAAYELLAGVNLDDPGTGIEEAEGLSEDSLT